VVKAVNLDRSPAAGRLRREVAAVGGVLLDGYMDRAELGALFDACDAYVSLHRSEGFGLTMAEAMALGKPVVATGYSGNTDFMTEDNSYLVPWRPLELTEDVGPYERGNVWADPDLDAAAALLRRVASDPEEAFRKGALARRDMAERFSPAAAGRAARLALSPSSAEAASPA
jgi:glycosyltransferase involved in cell wall biosynthesis